MASLSFIVPGLHIFFKASTNGTTGFVRISDTKEEMSWRTHLGPDIVMNQIEKLLVIWTHNIQGLLYFDSDTLDFCLALLQQIVCIIIYKQ